MTWTAARLRRARGAGQLLSGGARSAVGVVGHLLAVQGQDLAGTRLAIRARSRGLTAADVDRALDDGRLLVTWLGRGTLHLVRVEDYPWLWALLTPGQATGIRRRLAQEGVPDADAERAVDLIGAAVAADGPQTRAEMLARLGRAGIRTQGQAGIYLLGLAALRGVVVRGPLRGAQQAYVHTATLPGGRPQPLTGAARERALGDLAVGYLRGHGPADTHDLARWTGLPVGAARAAVSAAGERVVEVGGGLLDLADRRPPTRPLPARLLPAFDPYVVGWRDRTFAVPAEHRQRHTPGGGMFLPLATVDGLAVGTWRLERSAAGARAVLSPFDGEEQDLAAVFAGEDHDLGRFLARA